MFAAPRGAAASRRRCAARARPQPRALRAVGARWTALSRSARSRAERGAIECAAQSRFNAHARSVSRANENIFEKFS
jgi:hypothetical protein